MATLKRKKALTPPAIYQTLLTVPGNGLYTVSNGQGVKENFWQSYYNTKSAATVQTRYEQSWKRLWRQPPQVGLLGFPFDGGAGIMRGSNWGPLFLRAQWQRLLGNSSSPNAYFDLGDVKVIPHLLEDSYLRPTVLKHFRQKLSYPRSGQHWPVSPYSVLYAISDQWYQDFPKSPLLILGGDHGMSWFTFLSWWKSAQKRQCKPQQLGLLHFDAHTDLLVERLGVEHCFGTWASHASQLLPKNHLVQLGIRSSGKPKAHWEKAFSLKQFWAKEILQQKRDLFLSQLLKHFQKQGVNELYVSVDIDALDVSYASSTGTAEPSPGLPLDFICETINYLSKHLRISGGDLVEVAPWIRSPSAPLGQLEPETTLTSGALILNTLMDAMIY